MPVNYQNITEKHLALIFWTGIMLLCIAIVSLVVYVLFMSRVNYQLTLENTTLKLLIQK